MEADYGSLMTKAREQARASLAQSSEFAALSVAEQLATYRDTVQEEYEKLRPAGPGEATPLATEMRRGGPVTAGKLIDDAKHRNVRIEQAGELAGEFVQEVDFPGFVRDLLKAVFDANIEVTLKQMEVYKDLMKVASSSVAKFVREIDNTAAFGYLAENNPDEFNFAFDDEEKDEDGNPAATLTDKEGNKIDLGDNEVKAKIMDAKIAMAKEHRALIREMILMGVTRLVIDKGTIKASVLFDMKATETIQRKDKAAVRDSTSVTRHFGGGFLGFIGGGKTRTRTTSTLTVSSVKSQADTSLAARLSGSVEIIYKSDYFKLDNFAAMYAPQAAQEGAQPAGTPS